MKNDIITTWSRRGDALDVLAGSAFFTKFTPYDSINRFSTVDREDSFGANPKLYDECFSNNDQDYSCTFGGTSAAAPLVTGVVALLLSVDSNLTRDNVQDILRSSAVKVLNGDTLDESHIPIVGYGRVSGVRALSSIMRGDVNGIPGINILDLYYLIAYWYQSGPLPFPDIHFGDVNCDSKVNTLDVNYMINYIFRQGPAPIKPCLQIKPGM